MEIFTVFSLILMRHYQLSDFINRYGDVRPGIDQARLETTFCECNW